VQRAADLGVAIRTGTSSGRDRPSTKTQNRKPNRDSYAAFRRTRSSIAAVVSRS
jgi:hypothetical protein